MMKIADLLESRSEQFVSAESRDQGKPLSLAKMIDIPRAIYNFRFFGTAILHQSNRWVYEILYTMHRPSRSFYSSFGSSVAIMKYKEWLVFCYVVKGIKGIKTTWVGNNIIITLSHTSQPNTKLRSVYD